MSHHLTAYPVLVRGDWDWSWELCDAPEGIPTLPAHPYPTLLFVLLSHSLTANSTA